MYNFQTFHPFRIHAPSLLVPLSFHNLPLQNNTSYNANLLVINPIETIVAFMRRAIAFLSGPWAHVCDENKGFIQTPVTFLS